jgi:hypothetical protein
VEDEDHRVEELTMRKKCGAMTKRKKIVGRSL